ncbi:MAG: RNA polymerase sigma-70 factor [Bacteroidales bacterium]
MANEIEKFEAIFRKYNKRLCHYAFKFIENETVAQDIVQDIFVNLWDKKEITEIEIVLRAYLFRSVYNRCINYLEHKNMTQRHHQNINYELKRLEIDYYKSTNDQEYSLFELEIKIDDAIESLPPQCRNVFEKSRLKGMKNREIAEELNISVKVVEKHISKALTILRDKLIDYMPLILFALNVG